MKRIKWLVMALMLCLALTSAALAEAQECAEYELEATPENVAEVPEEVAFEMGGEELQAFSKAATSVAIFPDERFRDWVTVRCDTDSDGMISDSEAASVTSMDVSGLGIASLSGIERFTGLEWLNCSDNSLTELNLSGNPALSYLDCAGNALEWLDLTGVAVLENAVAKRPNVSGENMVFQAKVNKATATVAVLPLGCALLMDGGVFYDPAQDLELTRDEAVLGVKQTLKLFPENPVWPLEYCTFSTSNKKIAKVSDKGVVTAVKAGSATITVTAFDGRRVQCDVEVMKAPGKVTLSPEALSLGVGESATLEAILPENTASDLTWSSSNPGVIDFDEDGELVALQPGVATVTVKTFNSKRAKCTVTVGAVPTYLSLNVSALNLMKRQVDLLTPVMPQGAGGTVTWASSNPAVVQIDGETGVMEALEEGQATVTCTSYNGLTADCVVTVTPGPDRIALGADSAIRLGVGNTLNLDAVALRNDGAAVGQQLDYASSNSKIATVSSGGLVTAKKKGKATVTVSAPNGVTAECAVTVVKAPSSIKLNKKTLKLNTGDTETLKVSMSSSTASPITWESSRPDIVDVDDEGNVTALQPGEATVTAFTYNNKKAKCAVTVNVTGQDIVINPDPVTPVTPSTPTTPSASRKLVAVAHRGGRAYWEENTLEAFSHSASTGATMIEMDVQTTSDGVQVINHDATIKSGSKSYKIEKNTYAKLKSVKPSLCTLDEALEVIYKTGLDLQLELKESADAAKCVSAIAKHDMKDRTWYISFKTKQLSKVRSLDKNARLGYIFEKSIPSDLNSTVASLKIAALMVQKDLLTQSRLDSWHDAGLLVNAWTCNTREECRRFANMGVDFITSDYPDYAAEVAG